MFDWINSALIEVIKYIAYILFVFIMTIEKKWFFDRQYYFDQSEAEINKGIANSVIYGTIAKFVADNLIISKIK